MRTATGKAKAFLPLDFGGITKESLKRLGIFSFLTGFAFSAIFLPHIKFSLLSII
jgi:hypothetical protein